MEKRGCLRKVLLLGSNRINIEGLNLTKLISRPSLVINTAIALNRIAIKLETLFNSRANIYIVINL